MTCRGASEAEARPTAVTSRRGERRSPLVAWSSRTRTAGCGRRRCVGRWTWTVPEGCGGGVGDADTPTPLVECLGGHRWGGECSTASSRCSRGITCQLKSVSTSLLKPLCSSSIYLKHNNATTTRTAERRTTTPVCCSWWGVVLDRSGAFIRTPVFSLSRRGRGCGRGHSTSGVGVSASSTGNMSAKSVETWTAWVVRHGHSTPGVSVFDRGVGCGMVTWRPRGRHSTPGV